MTNQELAKRLRALADLYYANPEAPQLYHLTGGGPEFVFCMTKYEAAAAIRAFGPGRKEDDEDGIRYYPTTWPEIMLHIFKSNVCERVKVGEREVPEIRIEAKPATEEVVIPAYTEEIYEWRCGALLDTEVQP